MLKKEIRHEQTHRRRISSFFQTCIGMVHPLRGSEVSDERGRLFGYYEEGKEGRLRVKREGLCREWRYPVSRQYKRRPCAMICLKQRCQNARRH